MSYEVGQRKSGTIKVVNRGEEKVRVHMNVVPRSTMNANGGTENYSGTPHYDHPVNTTTLFWPEKTLNLSFSYLKHLFNTTTPFIRPIFHGLKVVALTGFHCNPEA